MFSTPKILVFSGSTRTDSYNKKLALLASKILAVNHCEVTFLDLRDLPMPLYDGDLETEKGLPENAKKFREILKKHHAFLICAPEYNGSITAVLKNAIDWASRPAKDEPFLVCFKGKIVNLMSASPAKWGGLRGLTMVRTILENIGCLVLPDQLCEPFADKAFTAAGGLEDAQLASSMEAMCKAYIKIATKMTVPDHCIEATQAFTK